MARVESGVFAAAAILAGCAMVLVLVHRNDLLAMNLEDARDRERQLGLLARVDPLTMVLNRSAFLAELERSIERHNQDGSHFALLMIDLDRFRNVNEVHGHAVGDLVLIEEAQRLLSFQAEDIHIARLGGDEFAVLIEDVHVSELPRRIAHRLIESLSTPIRIPQGLLRISATIGLVTSEFQHDSSEQLLRAADIALHQAKRDARGTFCFFEAGMDEALKLRSTLEADLRHAIANGEIVPFYQPLIALDDGRLTGFEVLARWEHPRYGLILPASFIPLAEELGRVGDMFYQLLTAACADAKTWPVDLGLSVNVSPTQFAEPQLAARILSILDHANLDPSRLELEITENALVDEVSSARLILTALRSVGVAVALDDFGTGYSSLRHLNELPIDRLKIDRMFVEGARQNIENWKIVRAIIQFAHALNLETTAEGIEIADVADILRDVGCDIGQGYLFGKPLSAAATATWLNDVVLGQSAFTPKLIN